jgi:Glycerophosphoryl diester phosphodiesterase
MKTIFPDKQGLLVFGHRGLPSKEKENTLISFQAAVLSGVDGIELDVHLTKDGRLAVIHDYNTFRTTGTDCEIETHTMAEIQAVDWQIPELEDVLDAFSDKILYDIEIKNTNRPNKLLEKLVAGEIRKRHLEKNVLVSSFNPFSMHAFHKIAPDIPLSPIFEIDEAVPGILQKGFGRHFFPVTVLKPGIKTAEEIINRLGARYPVAVWCVDTAEEYRKFAALGARIIITDKADEILRNVK